MSLYAYSLCMTIGYAFSMPYSSLPVDVRVYLKALSNSNLQKALRVLSEGLPVLTYAINLTKHSLPIDEPQRVTVVFPRNVHTVRDQRAGRVSTNTLLHHVFFEE